MFVLYLYTMKQKKEFFNISLYVVFFFVLMLFTSTYFVIISTNFNNPVARLTKDYVVYGNGDISTYYTAEEIDHLNEVKELFGNFADILKYLWLSFILVIYFFRSSLFRVSKNMFDNAFKLTSIFIISITLVKLILFDNLFALFHRLFFTTQWSFSSKSLLIQLFPMSFWMRKTFDVIVLTFALYFVVLILYRKRLKKK